GWQMFTKASDGTGPESVLFRTPGFFNYPLDWSRDGRWILARCADNAGDFDLWKIPMDGSGAPSVYQRTPELELVARFSPDGKWIAYVAREGEQQLVYVQSFPDPGTKYQVAIKNPE